MMDKELARLLTVVTIAGIVGIAGSLYGLSYINALTFKGQKYDVTVTVQATEKSTRFGDHTNVWCLVYGNQDITYTFFEHLDFEVGKTYRIRFTNQMKFTLYGCQVWGKVTAVEAS